MKYLDLTFADPAKNLACDEALLNLFDSDKADDSLLRIWEPKNYFVVLGHSNKFGAEVRSPECVAAGIPVLRRISGGGTVLQGPGCLNYSLLLSPAAFPCGTIGECFDYILKKHRQFVGKLKGGEVRIEGISDLALAGRKFSGNSQYRKRNFILAHGTFLLNFDLALMDRCLRLPAKQPDYRARRPHLEFVTNLQLEPHRFREELARTWDAGREFKEVPWTKIDELSKQRYQRADWTEKF